VFGVVGEEVPCGAGFVDDIVVAFEHGDSEFVAAQIFPDIFDRVQLWSVGRQADERDVAWNGESGCDVIACAIDDKRSMRSRRDTAADFGQMHGHGIGIGGGQDERRRSAALRTDGAKNVGPLVALVAWRTRPCSSLGPDAGQRPLLTDASLVLEPDFDRLVLGVVGKLCRDRRGEVFLNASWASSLACGWRGRTESRR
jgi:hypothetical protein